MKLESSFSYLKEGRGHGSSWHAIVGWHVAHHWTGGGGCALKTEKQAFIFSDAQPRDDAAISEVLK